VRAADITYIPMVLGFLYLVVVMDWYSRDVLAWRLSNTMDTSFCLDALEDAVRMDRRRRWLDNVFLERTWRSMKYGPREGLRQ